MKVKLVSIGNSKGVRIPRAVIDACGFGEDVEMRVSDGTVVIAPARAARAGWDTDFERMAQARDDVLLVPDQLENDWNEGEWEW